MQSHYPKHYAQTQIVHNNLIHILKYYFDIELQLKGFKMFQFKALNVRFAKIDLINIFNPKSFFYY